METHSGSQERSRTELIVKTVALHVAVLAAAGHLTTLQSRSRNRAKEIIWEMCWFIAVPTYPIAILIDRILQVLRIFRRKRRQHLNLNYCVSGILGMHAERMVIGQNVSGSNPLLEARPEDVRSVALKRDWLWIGRLTVLSALITQSVATIVLSARRLKAGSLSEIDIRNAVMALGGLTVQLISLFILLLSQRWEYIPAAASSPVIWTNNNNDLGAMAKISIAASTMLNSWYFRFHIWDTYAQVLKREEEKELYTFPRNLRPLHNDPYQNFPEGRHFYQNENGPRFSLLPNLYWLVWLLLLYPAQSSQFLSLLASAFLSLSFPIEELVSGGFYRWKDPLAEKLYVF